MEGGSRRRQSFYFTDDEATELLQQEGKSKASIIEKQFKQRNIEEDVIGVSYDRDEEETIVDIESTVAKALGKNSETVISSQPKKTIQRSPSVNSFEEYLGFVAAPVRRKPGYVGKESAREGFKEQIRKERRAESLKGESAEFRDFIESDPNGPAATFLDEILEQKSREKNITQYDNRRESDLEFVKRISQKSESNHDQGR